MLDAVLANFIDSVTEREFDAPFMALLRSLDFYDVHLLHGQYEFGKDFIAKRLDSGEASQYVFQSKAGNLRLPAWNAVRGQIDMLRRNQLAHPSFDAAVPRRAVLVMTGRLVGGAALEAQDYCRDLENRGEVGLEIWDRERLIELTALTVGLAGRAEGPLLGVVAAVDDRAVTEKDLELFSRRWHQVDEAWPCALEAAIVARRLADSDRADLACYVGLALVRAACWHSHGQELPIEKWSTTAGLGRLLFATYAQVIWERRASGAILDPIEMIAAHGEPAALITYPVRCVRLMEVLGLLGLMEGREAQPSGEQVSEWLAEFMARQRGAAFPISDRWAVALVPPVLLLARRGLTDKLLSYFQSVTKWVADRYGDGVGLAGPSATAEEEVRQVIGNAVRPGDVTRRSESYIATILLDLYSVLGLQGTYRLCRNEFRAVGALPCVLATKDTAAQYLLDGPDLSYEPNAPYLDELSPDRTVVAPHLARAAERRYLQQLGRSWDHLAVSAVLRDRHFVSAWLDFLQ